MPKTYGGPRFSRNSGARVIGRSNSSFSTNGSGMGNESSDTEDRSLFFDRTTSVYSEILRHGGGSKKRLSPVLLELKTLALSQIEWCRRTKCMRYNVTGDTKDPVYACWVLDGDRRLILLKDYGFECIHLGRSRVSVPERFNSKDRTAYTCNLRG